jgi:shikimate kinase
MNIILIGYRGTGKTCVGKILAESLQRPFYDTDELVETAAGRSIKRIVAENGWSFFREMEKNVIRDLADLPEGIIATGGGAVMDKENAAIMKKMGILIWLVADVETIVRRLQGDVCNSEKRPALNGDDTFLEIRDVLEIRTPIYGSLADFSINTTANGKGVEAIVEEIHQRLKAEGII